MNVGKPSSRLLARSRLQNPSADQWVGARTLLAQCRRAHHNEVRRHNSGAVLRPAYPSDASHTRTCARAPVPTGHTRLADQLELIPSHHLAEPAEADKHCQWKT